MSAIEYKKRLKQLEILEPYNKREKEIYTKQELAFIRGIQITRGLDKDKAKKHFLYSKRKNTDELKQISQDIREAYEFEDETGKITILDDNSYKTEPQKPIKKTKGYKYKGVSKKADIETKRRFLCLKGTSRRYLDLKTGEEISRRERDHRLYLLTCK